MKHSVNFRIIVAPTFISQYKGQTSKTPYSEKMSEHNFKINDAKLFF